MKMRGIIRCEWFTVLCYSTLVLIGVLCHCLTQHQFGVQCSHEIKLKNFEMSVQEVCSVTCDLYLLELIVFLKHIYVVRTFKWICYLKGMLHLDKEHVWLVMLEIY